MTVEQRVYSRDDEDSQRVEKPLVVEDEVLSENGLKVKRSLLTVIESYKANSPELANLVLQKLEQYPGQLFDQLGLVIESPIFKAQEGQKGHWIYELTMVDRTMACAGKIKEFFGRDDRFISDLIFMIVIGDIGKAGPVPGDEGPEAAIVSRIYNQAIFHGAHQAWLKSCDPSSFPAELDQALARIDRNEPENGGVSQWDFIFKNGAFIGLPIEVYLYVLKQVALTKLNGNPVLVERLFSLHYKEKEFLSEHGFNPTTTPIRKFFTASHIQFGLDFLSREGFLDAEQKQLVLLALAHHFSQGELPAGLDVETLLNDEDRLKTCAYLEILDKVDAVFHRGAVVAGGPKDEDAKKAAVDSAVNIANTEIQTNLSRNYPDQVRLREIYSAVLSVMKQAGVFDFSPVAKVDPLAADNQ